MLDPSNSPTLAVPCAGTGAARSSQAVLAGLSPWESTAARAEASHELRVVLW